MTRDRSAATLIVLAAVLASPLSGASAATPAASALSAAPPSWLTAPAPSGTTTKAATPSGTKIEAAGSELPHTGDDLLTEVLVASGLLAAGATVRLRRA